LIEHRDDVFVAEVERDAFSVASSPGHVEHLIGNTVEASSPLAASLFDFVIRSSFSRWFFFNVSRDSLVVSSGDSSDFSKAAVSISCQALPCLDLGFGDFPP
jgi:hypothetical protein